MATPAEPRDAGQVPRKVTATDNTRRPRGRPPAVLFADGSNITITGQETLDTGRPVGQRIPVKARFKIWSLPDEHVVREGRATRKIVTSLDPGRYRIKVVKSLVERRSNVYKKAVVSCNWGYEFYVGITPDEFRKLEHVKPQMRKDLVMTTGNFSRPGFGCGHPQCEEEFDTEIALTLHEMEEHFKVDPRKASDEELESAGVVG